MTTPEMGNRPAHGGQVRAVPGGQTAAAPKVPPTNPEHDGGAPWSCPDCAVSVDRGTRTLRHSDGCPVGADAERTSDRDREFFEEHPFADEYSRPLSWSERVALTATHGLPPGTRLTGRTTVRKVAPGIRARMFSGLAARPAEGADG